MTVICEEDVIASVADALQYISYYHSPDFIRAMGRAYAAEQSPAARDAIAQILTNSRMCAEGHRPICQDTGIVVVRQGGHGCSLAGGARSGGDDQRGSAQSVSESR
jgi:fumarate hydratase, class I